LKVVLAIGILAYVVWHVRENNAELIPELLAREKNWAALVGAFLVTLAGVAVTFVRWHMLVVTLGIPFTLSDAFRLGSVGYLLNFISVGSVGGDLFKAVFIAHEQPERKTEAVATVVLDRLMGLYGLFVVSGVAVLFLPLDAFSDPETSGALMAMARAAQIGAVVGTLCIGLLFVPGVAEGTWWSWAEHLPLVGPHVATLHATARAYRDRPLVVLIAVLMSFVTHFLNALSLYLAACAFFPDPPTMGEHLVIAPMAVFAGSVPLTPAGLGAFEGALDLLYAGFGGAKKGVGLVVALVFRVLTLGVAAVGVGYYLSCREEVEAALKETEAEEKTATSDAP